MAYYENFKTEFEPTYEKLTKSKKQASYGGSYGMSRKYYGGGGGGGGGGAEADDDLATDLYSKAVKGCKMASKKYCKY